MKPNPVPSKISETAAIWVARIEHGLTPVEQDQFLDWLSADPRHGKELNAQQASWDRLNRLADWRPEHGTRPNRDLLAPSPPIPFLRRPRFRLGLGLAAAALAIGIYLAREQTLPSDRPVPAPIASIEQRTLPDGSTIELNRNAELAVVYTETERRVRLDHGEASFTVAKNPDRPFVVTAGGVDVRAVGTVFNVRFTPDQVEVIVTEGKVQIQPTVRSADPAAMVTLVAAGERAVVPLVQAAAVTQLVAVTPEDLHRRLAWHPAWLDFTEQPLSAVIDEFNRRNEPIRLVIADPSLSDTLVSASLRSDKIENFLRLLEGTFHVRSDRDGNTITLRRARD